MGGRDYGRELYLQEKYDEALKYLRKDDPFERMLIESIHITPKDKSTNGYLRSPQLTLVEIAIIRGKFIRLDQQNKQETYSEFLKKSSNAFVGKLINILETLWRSEKVDFNLLNSLNEREKAITWYYVSLVYCYKGNYKKSRDILKDLIEYYEKIGEDYYKALTLWLLGLTYEATGYYDMSHEIYSKILEIFEKFNDWYKIVHIKHRIAWLYWIRQDAEMCLELSKQVLNMLNNMESVSVVSIALAKAYMGLAYLLMRQYEIALRLFDEASQVLKEYHPLGFAVLAARKALVYIDVEGKYEEALRLLDEAEEIYRSVADDHSKEWVYTCKAIILLKKGDVEHAKKLLKDALKIAKEHVRDYDDIVRILLHLVRSTSEKEKEKYIDEALWYYKKWRTDISSLITAKDASTRHDLRILVDSLLDSNVDKAYEAHLEVKNRSAVDIFGAEVISEDSIGDDGVRRLKEVEKRVKSAGNLGLIRAARKEISEVIEDKKIVVNTYFDVKGDEEVIDFHFGEKTGYFHRRQFKEIQFRDLRNFVEELLNDEAVKLALLELYEDSGIKGYNVKIDGDWVYIIYENGKYWWAKLKKQDDLLRLLNDILLACLTHQSHLAHVGIKVIDGKPFTLTFDEWKARIELSKYYQRTAEEILERSGEVFGDLFNYDEVIIAPAYPLVNFPYHLIMDSDGKMLIEATKVKYVPHTGVAERLRGRKGLKKVEKASIIYVDIPRACTKEEAKNIKDKVPDSEEIDATNVNKKVVLSRIRRDAKILHFACHAVAVPKAQYSYLSLSDDQAPRDPNLRLYLSDLLSLKLNDLSLVCLSACETGRYEDAIDTLGLPLAFFAKGAKNVIATQWMTHGGSAKIFFTEFYKLIVEGSDVYDAYYNAMLEIKRTYKRLGTFYWGPFMYCGI